MNVFTIASDKLFNLFIPAYSVSKKKQSFNESHVQESALSLLKYIGSLSVLVLTPAMDL